MDRHRPEPDPICGRLGAGLRKRHATEETSSESPFMGLIFHISLLNQLSQSDDIVDNVIST